MKILNAQDLMNVQFPKHVEIQGNEVGFPNHGYWIELSRIKNYRSLLAWVHHLAGKAWMTADMLGDFIEAVCGYKGWNVYGD